MTKKLVIRDGIGYVQVGDWNDGHPIPALAGDYVAEIERLRVQLKAANANHERFEREWYLRGDEIERLQQENAGLIHDNERLMTALNAEVNDPSRWSACDEHETTYPRGHSYAEHGTRHGKNQWRHCRLCGRIKERLRAGWTLEEATADLTPIPQGVKTKRRTFGAKRSADSGDERQS